MTIGIILEEPSIEPLVKILSKRLRINVETRVSRGKGKLRTKLVSYANDLSQNCNKILALVDSHCSDPSRLQEDFVDASKASDANIRICVIVHALESWFLADSQALAKKLRTKRLRTPANPENSCTPERELDRLFQLHEKEYIKNRDASSIAEMIAIETVARKCPSFRKFLKSLSDC